MALVEFWKAREFGERGARARAVLAREHIDGVSRTLVAPDRRKRDRAEQHRTNDYRPKFLHFFFLPVLAARCRKPIRPQLQPNSKLSFIFPDFFTKMSLTSFLHPAGKLFPHTPARVLHPRAPILFYYRNAPSVAASPATLGAILYKSTGSRGIMPLAGSRGRAPCTLPPGCRGGAPAK